MKPTRVDILKQELSYKQSSYRTYAQIEGELTRDERKEKQRLSDEVLSLQLRIQRLEKKEKS